MLFIKDQKNGLNLKTDTEDDQAYANILDKITNNNLIY